MQLLVHIDLAGADLEAFEAYEAAVLPLLADHGGEVLQRLRGVDRLAETHLLGFPSRQAYEAYLADPRRTRLFEQRAATGMLSEAWEVRAV